MLASLDLFTSKLSHMPLFLFPFFVTHEIYIFFFSEWYLYGFISSESQELWLLASLNLYKGLFRNLRQGQLLL